MSVADLKRYPLLITPQRGESLPGFLHRLATANGLASVGWIRQDLELRPPRVEWSDEHFARFSIYSGQPIDALRALHCPMSPGSNLIHFMGHLVDKRMLHRGAMRYCPVCLSEHGYHQLIWSLRFVTHCPLHGCRILERCSQCHTPFAWRRVRFMECRCGAPLPVYAAAVPGEQLPSERLQAVRALYEKCGISHGGEPVLPALPPDFATLDLEDFCSLIWFVGCTRDEFSSYGSRVGPMLNPPADMHVTLQHGYELLVQWPAGIHSWMRRVHDAHSLDASDFGGSGFKALLQKLRNLRRPRIAAFIKDAAVSYAIERGASLRDAPSLFVPSGGSRYAGFVTLSGAAEIIGCTPATAKAIALKEGWIQDTIGSGGWIKFVPEKVVRDYARKLRPELGLDEVRRRLRLDHPTLRALIAAGILGERRRLPRYKSGAREWSIVNDDVDALMNRISSSIQVRRAQQGSRAVTLKSILIRKNRHKLGFTDFISGVLRQELIPVGPKRSMRGLGDLSFDEIEAVRFCVRQSATTRQFLTASEAGLLLSLPTRQIRAAILIGILPFKQVRAGRKERLVSMDDLTELGRLYVSTTELARRYRCTVQTIRAVLQSQGIHPVREGMGKEVECCFYLRQRLVGLNLPSLIKRHRAKRRKKTVSAVTKLGSVQSPSLRSKLGSALSPGGHSLKQLPA